MRNRIGAALALIPVAAVLLTGCSTDDAGTIPAGGGGTGGNAACDPGAFGNTLGAILHESLMMVESIDGFECADGWAVVQATVAGEETPSVSEQYLFQATQDVWVLKSPETACGTIAEDGVRPADAAVPESLWEQACAAM